MSNLISPIDQLPAVQEVRARMGLLYRELALLRCLLRLCQSAKEQKPSTTTATKKEVVNVD